MTINKYTMFWLCLFATRLTIADEAVADFASHTYDRRTFRAFSAAKGPTFGSWDLNSPALRARIPRGSADRQPLRFVGLFTLKGDFEVTADYAIAHLPRPKSADGTNRLQIFLRSSTGTAILYRGATRGGDWVGYDITARSGPSPTEQVPTGATSGRLRIERRGVTLTFAHNNGGKAFEPIGSVAFGTEPVTQFQFEVDPLNTRDEVDVQLNRVEVRADKIERRTSAGAGGISYWVWGLILAVIGVGFEVARRRLSTAS